jgi:aspartate/tyrosine/aromatic aminotransferase
MPKRSRLATFSLSSSRIYLRYLDDTGINLDISGLLEDLSSFPTGSIVLFHNCAHNPSGVDPSEDLWRQIAQIVRERRYLSFFDNAYQVI